MYIMKVFYEYVHILVNQVVIITDLCKNVLLNRRQMSLEKRVDAHKGSSINDVTQIWIIFYTPSPIVTLFITKALVQLS